MGMGPTSYHIPLKDMPTIYKCHRSLTCLPYRSMDGGLFTKLIIYEYYLGPSLVSLKSKIQCVFLTSPLTQHCFTANDPVQYLSELALVPRKHRCTTNKPVQYPGAVTHTSLIASIIFEILLHPYRYFRYM